MLKLRIKVKSLSGEKYENDEELPDEYILSRQNPEFLKLIDDNLVKSHLKEIDSVKVTAFFGEI